MFLTIFLSILSLITFVISAPLHQSTTESIQSISQCQSGRVCMNSCYSNGQLTNCHKLNVLKSVLFDPPFSQILPSIHLRLVRIDSEDDVFNEDVVIKKEDLTSRGMNIRFNLLTESTTDIICVDWQACSLDSNLLKK